MESYRGFILRMCNDGKSYDILTDAKTHYALICIVGSHDRAVEWVDEWYKKNDKTIF